VITTIDDQGAGILLVRTLVCHSGSPAGSHWQIRADEVISVPARSWGLAPQLASRVRQAVRASQSGG
jgi:hypothetical protein